MISKYQAVILGLGRIASLLEEDTRREKPATHAGALSAHGGFDIIAGCDPDPQRRESFGIRWGGPALYSTATDLFKNHKPDLAVVATYPETHDLLVRQAVQAGVKVIICEKPLTPTARSSRALVRFCEKSGAVLMVNHERRYARDFKRVKGIIQSQIYGNLLSIFAKIYMGRKRTPGEVLFWDGTHMLDILRFLTDQEFSRIRSWGRAKVPGESLMSSFSLGKTRGVLEVGSGRDHLSFELDLSFQSGRVRIGNGIYEEFKGGESPFYDNMRSLIPVEVNQEELYPSEYFSAMAADGYRVLTSLALGTPVLPLSSGRDGLRAVEAIEKFLAKSLFQY